MNIASLAHKFEIVFHTLEGLVSPPQPPPPTTVSRSGLRSVGSFLPLSAPALTTSITARSLGGNLARIGVAVAATAAATGILAAGLLLTRGTALRSPIVLGVLVALGIAACAEGESRPVDESDAASGVEAGRPTEVSPVNSACSRVDALVYQAQAARLARDGAFVSSIAADAGPADAAANDAVSDIGPDQDASGAYVPSERALVIRHPNAQSALNEIHGLQGTIGPIVSILDSGSSSAAAPYQAGRVAIVTARGTVFFYSHNGADSDLQALSPRGTPIAEHPNAIQVLNQATAHASALASEMGQGDGDGGIQFGVNQPLFSVLQRINPNSIFISYRGLMSDGGVDTQSNAPLVIVNLGAGTEVPGLVYSNACPTLSQPAQHPQDAGSDVFGDVPDLSDVAVND
ncbi:MAG: hypothetical protein HQM15_06955 [Deltaproteobacteria bacterium]|nr:hypothetical protein [Deltaproteobacteria bacterium]